MSESLRDTIEPKSDQLNADDLMTGPITVTVESVSRGTPDQPVKVCISGHRPYLPCKSMRRVLISAWGDKGIDWVGKSMTLYCDPSIKFGGVAVGGIRISHLSHIDKNLELMLTSTRSKRTKYIVAVLDNASKDYPGDMFIKNIDAWVKAINNETITLDGLIDKVSSKGNLTPSQIEDLLSRINPIQKDELGSNFTDEMKSWQE